RGEPTLPCSSIGNACGDWQYQLIICGDTVEQFNNSIKRNVTYMSFRLSLLFTLLIFICLPAFGQGDGQGTALIKTEGGMLWVENRESVRFILEIKGGDIHPMRQYPFLSVDGRPMQVHLVEIEKFYKATGDTKANDLVIMRAHRDWEADHHSNLLNSK